MSNKWQTSPQMFSLRTSVCAWTHTRTHTHTHCFHHPHVQIHAHNDPVAHGVLSEIRCVKTSVTGETRSVCGSVSSTGLLCLFLQGSVPHVQERLPASETEGQVEMVNKHPRPHKTESIFDQLMLFYGLFHAPDSCFVTTFHTRSTV